MPLHKLCSNELVISGTAHVRAPREKVRRPRVELPGVQLSRHERLRALLAKAAGYPPLATAVAYPCDANALGAAVEAAQAGLIIPILVGPKEKIIATAKAANLDISDLSVGRHAHQRNRGGGGRRTGQKPVRPRC